MPTPRIPDGQPMSKRTLARRRSEAGLTRPVVPATINETFFREWSPELAWLVGLIWSDGNLSGRMVEISSADLQLIDLVIGVVGGGRYALKNRGRHIRLHFSSTTAAQFLREIGLTENKSLTIGWPDMPGELAGHFVRGLIDGDGSVMLSQRRPGQQAPDLSVQLVTASPRLRDAVSEWLTAMGIAHRTRERAPLRPGWHPLWRIEIIRQADLHRLHDVLYPNEDVPCLHRKRLSFDHWIATPRGKGGRPFRASSTSSAI